MSRGGPLATFLFWLMFLVSGAGLVVGLYLPPWLEYRALQQRCAAARTQLERVEARLLAVERQIEHFNNDPAYVERLGRQEFGIHAPGIETVVVEGAGASQIEAASQAVSTSSPAEELAQTVERLAHNQPVLSIFILDQTRPLVLSMFGGLMLAAIVLLSQGRRRPVEDVADVHEQRAHTG